MAKKEEKKEHKFFKIFTSSQNIIIAVLVVIAVVGPAATLYIYNKYRPINTKVIMGAVSSPQLDEVSMLAEKVRQHMDLPYETPTIATVSDLEKLKSQPFFSRAKQGDKVLFYQSLKKAILFRPSTNRIIDVATLNIGGTSGVNSNVIITPSVTKTERNDKDLRVIVWNGTTTSGIAQKGEDALKAVANITVKKAEEGSQKRDYENTIVINLNGVPEAKIKEIAGVINGKIEKLPTFEEAPPYDILIILGREFIK